MNRAGLKIGSAAAAIVIWIQVASTTVIETDLALPLSVTNLPAGLTLAGNMLPETALVRVRASKLRIMAHKYLQRPVGSVEIDLRGRAADAPFLYEITPADVRTQQQVVAVLPPARLPLRLDRQNLRRVPVLVPTEGTLPAGKVMAGRPVANPETVEIAGPERYLRSVRGVATAPVDLSDVGESRTFSLPLVLPHPELVADVSEVEVYLKVSDLDNRVVADVPVTAVADRARGEVAVSPPVCDVTVEGPADSIRALLATDLVVTVDASGTQEAVQQVRARVQYPAWATRVTIVPEMFTVIAGESRHGRNP